MMELFQMKKSVKLLISNLLVISIILLTSSTTNAEDTNELLELYDMEQIAGDQSIFAKVNESEAQYLDAVKNAELSEDYNNMLEIAEEYNSQKIAELDDSIDKIMLENDELQNEIKSCFNSDWERLLELDAMYKNNVSKINNLLHTRSSYNLSGKQEVDYSSVQTLEEEYLEVRKEYQDTIDVMELGEVTNVKYPIKGNTEIVNNYGDIVDPITKEGIINHSGIDLKADTGTEVLAAFNGIVNTTGYGPLGGYYISIYHGSDIITYYCHLSQINCKVGDKVSQYDVIGLSGDSGEDTKVPLLHFGLYYKNNRMDPSVLFER